MFRRQALLLLVAVSFAGSNLAFGDDVALKQPNFFPKGVFSDRADAEDLVRNWYSEQLRALEEPSLYPPKPDVEVYRFTWLRTFHSPMVFRFTVLDNGSATLIVKRGTGKGGYEPGVVDLRKEVALGNGQVEELKKKLYNMSYWQMPTKMADKSTDGAQWIVSTDGAHWIVEANAKGKYQIVDRKGGTDPDIQALGMQLITLSGVDVGEVY
jgi:hypothetical protein